MAELFAFVAHRDGVADDTALELLTAARAIDPAASATAIVAGAGAELDAVAAELARAYSAVWIFRHDALRQPNAEALRPLLAAALPAGAIVLLANDTLGMDLGPGLSVKLGAAYVPDVVGIEGLDGGGLRLVRQEFGGQVCARVTADLSRGAVLTPRAGSFAPAQPAAGAGAVLDKSAGMAEPAPRRQFLELLAPEAGDVDITKSEILVSIGRGIESEDNIGLARDLARALGAELACSRPIVDARWLERARQVGTSGQTVKPKIYLACGISGAFQHIGGLKGSPFLVAVNKNPKAPIFQVADVGIVADILEFMPELTVAVTQGR